MIPIINKLFKKGGYLEKLGEDLYDKGLIGKVSTEGFYTKLFGARVGQTIANSPLGLPSKVSEMALNNMPLLTGNNNVVVNNENNITLNGTDATPQAVGQAVGTETKNSVQDISNIIAPVQQ